MFTRTKAVYAVVLLTAVLSHACARQGREFVLRPAMDMRAVIDAHLGRGFPEEDWRSELRKQDSAGRRNEAIQMDGRNLVRFPRLYNPDLLMWVHAHTNKDVYVPGYPVAFPMYRGVHAAFAGEEEAH